MDIVLKTKGKDDALDTLPKDQLEEFKKNRDQMRMYSFKQLFNIFTETNNKSEVQDRVTKNEADIQTLFKNIEELRNTDKANREHADSEFANVRAEIRSNKTE